MTAGHHRHRSWEDVPLPGLGSDEPAPGPVAPPAPGPAAPPAATAAPAPPFAVEVVRSARRKRTVGAQLRGDVLYVHVPAWMNPADEARWVREMTGRFTRRLSTEAVDLDARVAVLARRYRLPEPRSARWADMTSRWGSCTPATGDIRLSNRLARFPPWVLDYVIVHELAHLVVPDHSADFWTLVTRYPKAERARGFLIAKSGDADGDAD